MNLPAGDETEIIFMLVVDSTSQILAFRVQVPAENREWLIPLSPAQARLTADALRSAAQQLEAVKC